MMVDLIILSILDSNQMSLMRSDFIYLIRLEFSNSITSSHTPLEFEAAWDLFLLSGDKLITLQKRNNYQGLPLVLAEYIPLPFG